MWPKLGELEELGHQAECFTGKALEVYSRLDSDAAKDYEKLKVALLKRYDFTEDGYRVRFRDIKPEVDESPDQFIVRLTSYLVKWVELSDTGKTYEGIRNLMVKEQFINCCPVDLSVHLRERAPTTLDDLAKYAEHFVIAHNRQLASKVFPNVNSPVYISRSQSNYSRRPESQIRCHKCSRLGHIAQNCKVQFTQGQSQNLGQSLKRCYSCGKPGHDVRACKFGLCFFEHGK